MTSLETPVLRASRLAEAYWFEDGLENIYRGLLLLLLSVDFFLAAPGPDSSLYGLIYPFLPLCGIALFGVLILGHRSVLEWINTKTTVPRIGYVAPPPSSVGIERHDTGFWPPPLPIYREEEYLDRQKKLRAWIYAFVVLLVVLALSKIHERLHHHLVVLIWALFFGLASKYTQPPGRAAWTGLAICVSAGIAVVLFSSPGTRPVGVLFPLLGGISAAIGIFQLGVFLLRHPRRAQTES